MDITRDGLIAVSLLFGMYAPIVAMMCWLFFHCKH